MEAMASVSHKRRLKKRWLGQRRRSVSGGYWRRRDSLDSVPLLGHEFTDLSQDRLTIVKITFGTRLPQIRVFRAPIVSNRNCARWTDSVALMRKIILDDVPGFYRFGGNVGEGKIRRKTSLNIIPETIERIILKHTFGVDLLETIAVPQVKEYVLFEPATKKSRQPKDKAAWKVIADEFLDSKSMFPLRLIFACDRGCLGHTERDGININSSDENEFTRLNGTEDGQCFWMGAQSAFGF